MDGIFPDIEISPPFFERFLHGSAMCNRHGSFVSKHPRQYGCGLGHEETRVEMIGSFRNLVRFGISSGFCDDAFQLFL